MKNTLKSSIVVWVIVIVIVAIITGFFNYSKQDNSVSSLRYYTNSEFEYQIQYPDKYTLTDHGTSGRNIIELDQGILNSLRFEIIVSKNNPNPIAINDECADVSKIATPTIFGSNTFNVTVTQGARADVGNQLLSSEKRYYLKNSKNCYLIDAFYPPSITDRIKNDLLKEADSIVSTFTLK